MIKIFDRFYSVKYTFYFLIENVSLFAFLAWGTALNGEWRYLILGPIVYQVYLYSSEIVPPVSHFSMKIFLLEHLKAMFLAGGILFACYLIVPNTLMLALEPLLWRVAVVPLLLIGLRLGYQGINILRPLSIPIVIVGSGEIATTIQKFLQREQVLGYNVFHYQLDTNQSRTNKEPFESLFRFVQREKIQEVIIAMNDRRGQLPVDCLLKLRVQGIKIFDAVSFYEKIAGKFSVEWLKPSTLIFDEGFNRLNLLRMSKRLSDILFSTIGLIFSIPIFLIIPILIKLTSKGPILYHQERVGENGRPFMVKKFRSMCQDAEVESGPIWAIENDPRVTAVGKIIRLLRIDEIPQMINVLIGEMSFVGPRPERAVFVEKLQKKIPYYDLRFTVKPGLTGWAQIKYQYGASEKDALEKLQYDLYYIKHLSPLFDLTIVIETVRVVLFGTGAR